MSNPTRQNSSLNPDIIRSVIESYAKDAEKMAIVYNFHRYKKKNFEIYDLKKALYTRIYYGTEFWSSIETQDIIEILSRTSEPEQSSKEPFKEPLKIDKSQYEFIDVEDFGHSCNCIICNKMDTVLISWKAWSPKTELDQILKIAIDHIP
jgi:hypothetical protein